MGGGPSVTRTHLERRRDRDELLDLAIELGAKVLERRPQLEAPRLELEVARDLREVGVQPLEPELVPESREEERGMSCGAARVYEARWVRDASCTGARAP